VKEIVSSKNPIVSHLTALKKEKRYRKETGLVLVEGKNLVKDLLEKRKAKRLFVTKDFAEVNASLLKKLQTEELYLLSDPILQKITSTESPEGILAEVPMPKESDLRGKKRILALDRIQDPGNLGTLIRSALAFGWEGIFLIEPCCDPFNDKALRAAKGATFFIPLQNGNWETLQDIAKANKLSFFVADLEGISFEKAPKTDTMILVLGNEAEGVSPPQNLRATQITIPMEQKTESLNVAVAGGILLYALRNK